ncbi:MAG TPA: ABC transporter permease [Trebonia sp.]|nr:ABC transporter permease [Trebonia sp.]
MSYPLAAAPALREFTYWLYRYRRTWRGTIVISVANPLLFLAALGIGLGRLVDQAASPYLHGASYLAFFAPGMLAAAAMQTAFIESAMPVYESARERGNYRSAAITPLRPRDIFLGHLLFIVFRLTLSATAFVLVVIATRAVPIGRALPLIPAAVLTGLAFATPVSAWAVGVTRPVRIQGLYRFVLMPLYMFSGTFFSPSQLPGWLYHIVAVTPLYQGIALCRGVALGTSGLTGYAGYLAVLAAAGVAAGLRAYSRSLRN